MRTSETVPCGSPPRTSTYRLRVGDVTNTTDFEAELDPTARAGSVAQALARQVELPSDVPWGLRDDRGTFLDDERQIGEQVAADARVTLTPKSHLG